MNAGETIESDGGAVYGASTSPRARFRQLWRGCLIQGAPDKSAAVWDAMQSRYAEPHRHYHDARHLAHCFDQLELARERVPRPNAVELALWFHDVINEPGQPDNEQRSAEFFREWASGAMEEGFIEAVIDLILATTHRGPSDDPDHQYICDIDLASFGCQWECYKRDSDNLKAEFRGTEDEYYLRKGGFLNSMLSKPRIFQTDFFHDRYEERARGNIRRLLALFEQRLD
jgi:predicted metal-dependent HD superfamily phosphohydrolase